MKFVRNLFIINFILFSFIFSQQEKSENNKNDRLLLLLEKVPLQGKKIKLSDITFLKKLSLPKSLQNLFEKASIVMPKLEKKEVNHYSVVGKINLFGFFTEAILLVNKQAKKSIYSLKIQMPNDWKISDTFPNLKKLDIVSFESVYLIFSNNNYKDSFGQEIRKGINLSGKVRPSCKIIKKLNPVFGNKLNDISLQADGFLKVSNAVGSFLEIKIPVSTMITDKIGFTPMKLGIAVEENILQFPTLSIIGKGGMRTYLPRHQSPIDFDLQMKLTLEPLVARFLAKINGWVEIIPGLTLGQFKAGFTSDLALALETGFLGSISGLTVGAGSGYGDSKVWFTASGALSGTTGIGDLTLIGKGDWRLNDVVGFWLGWLYRGATLTRFIKKENILIDNVKKIKDKILEKLPNLKFEDVELSFVPRQTIEENKRILINVGRFQLLNQEAKGKLFVSKQGIIGKFHLKPMLIGPKGKPFIIVSDINNKEGLSFDINISKSTQKILFNCNVEIPLFGGIARGASMDLSTKGLEINGQQKVFGMFESNFKIKAKIDNAKVDDNFSINITMKQSALSKLSKLCSFAAQEIIKDSNEQIKFKENLIKESIDKWAIKRDEQTEKYIKDIEYKIKNIKKNCDKKYHSKMSRNICYFYGGIIDYNIKLKQLIGRKKISTPIIKTIGKSGLKIASKTAQISSGTFKKALNLVSNIAKQGINISHVQASGNLKDFTKGKPLKVIKFVAIIMGKKVELKDFQLKINDIPVFFAGLIKKSLAKEN